MCLSAREGRCRIASCLIAFLAGTLAVAADAQEPVPDRAPETVQEPASEPLSDPLAEAVANALAEPASDPLAEPAVPDPLADPLARPAAADAPAVYLFSVRINGWPLRLTARFHEEDGRLSIPADQFEGIGFRPNEAWVTTIDGQRLVYLDQIPGVTWQIDMATQTIDITTPYELLKPNTLRLNPGVARVESRSNWGALFSYDIYGEYSSRPRSDVYARTFSVNVEARIFSPLFMASTNGFYSISEGEAEGEFIRLDSSVDFDNVEHAWRLRLGDSITTGPIWVRTVRFGGIQFGREFSLRPDIVTTPIPVLNQNVSVPSTVDVFINETRRYSQAVDPGALRVTDLPVTTGANRVRVVVTDQSGRRVELFLPLYTSTELLGRGLSLFNLEVGAERREYASESFDYGPAFASGGVSYGVSDRLTLRGYGAGSRHYWMGAAGATFSLGRLFLVDTAAMYSYRPEEEGWSLYGSVEHISGPLSLYGSYQHSSRGFRDLAGNFGYTSFTDQVVASAGLLLGRFGQVNANYVLQRALDGETSSLVSGNYGLDLFRRQVNLNLSGYYETELGDWGAIVSISFPIGRRAQGYAEHSWRNGVMSSAANIRGDGFDDRLDWEIAGEQGDFDEVSAEAGWDGERIDMRFRAAQSHGEYGFRGELAQSLVFMDGRLNLAGRIDDGFAIVEVENIPGVRVALENRPIGRTNENGRLFITGLNSYVANAISIDPLDLPIDASVGDTSIIVSPRYRGGLVARFPINQASAAIVVLQRADGSPPPVGATVALEGSDATAVVGYDGEVYVRGLQDGANRLNVSWRDGQCSAGFSVEMAGGTLPRLGPFTCEP